MRPEPPPDDIPADPEIPFLAIEITSPAERATLTGPQNGTPITVSGRVLRQNSSLEKITVQIGNIVGEGVFTGKLWTYTGKSDVPGKVSIIAVAYGEDEITGILGTAQHEITVNIPDTVPPHEVTIVAPTSMKEISINEAGSPVSLEVTAQDYLGVGSVGCRLDASSVTTPADPSGQPLWKADILISPIPLGNRTITVRCADKVGNVTERTVTFVAIDTTPPHYEIIEPKEGQKIVAGQMPVNVTVKGKAWDLQSGMVGGQAVVEWDLNGKPPFQRASSANNWVDWEAAIPIVDYGFHIIRIRFTDRDGNSTIHLLNLEVISAYKPKNAEELLSYRGYLDELLKFSRDHISVPGEGSLSTSKLTEVFHQSFGELAQPLFEMGNQPVNQVRVCIEVLRKYLASGATVWSDSVWIEDSLPAGATPAQEGGDGWNWIGVNPAPYSGAFAHQSNIAVGMHQHSFSGVSSGFPIDQDDRLFAYVYLDAANLPEELMLQWNDGTWEHRAYWGADKIQVGVGGTDSRRYMGPFPAAGNWVRLEVPACLVGLEGKMINGMAFTLFGGRAAWDRAGKTSRLPLLLAHWKFDEGSGGTAFDSSGNGYHGTLQGGVTWDEGQFGGKALVFNGIDGYLQVGDVAHLKMSNVLTISAWIHPRGKGSHTNAGGMIVSKEGEYEVARFADGTIRCAFANSDPGWNWINTGTIALEKEWTHIAVVYDCGTVKTYANGGLVHIYDGKGPIGDINPAQNDFRIGGRQESSHYFQGLIDEVAIYNRPLSAGAIAVLAEEAPDDPSTAALSMAEFEYRLAVYQALLIGIGTSYDELRLARGATPVVRQGLADRLGIRLSKSASDELDQLLLQPADLTEASLEKLFGLVDTSRDPLVPLPKPELLNWQEAYLEAEWTRQDHPEQPGAEPLPLIIDPDQIDERDLRNPTPSNPAFDLWQTRKNSVDNWFATLKSQRENEPTLLAGFDKIVTGTLQSSMSDLLSLIDRSKQGENIEPDLKKLCLTQQTFSYLMRIRDLAGVGPVTNAEWDDIYNILTRVKKSQVYPAWRTDETPLTLSPVYFKISRSVKKLPAWRATQRARREWQDILQARIDQQQSIRDALQATVDNAEASYLTKLRDALVAAAGGQAIADDLAEWLTDTFLIDVKGGGSQTTTRILQAIETLQSAVFSLRTGQFDESHPAKQWDYLAGEEGNTTGEKEENFDKEWKWMGSYATWRAAMLVFLYPENILLPSLRENQDKTPQFDTLLKAMRAKPRLTPEDARNLAKAYLEAFPKVIAYWRFDEESGDTAYDATGGGAHGKLVNEPSWVSGKAGKALSFNGQNYVQVDHKPVLNLGEKGADFSVAFWMYIRKDHTGSWRSIMHKGNDPQRTFALWMHPDDNRVHYRISTTSNSNEGGDSTALIELNTWTHIAYVKDGNRLKLYINGAFDSEVALTGESVSNDELLYLGKDAYFSGIEGDLDDIQIYNGALSPGEVMALYKQQPVPGGLGRPFALTEQLSEAELEKLSQMSKELLEPYADADRLKIGTPIYLKEIFYYAPMQLALQLQKSGEQVAALDWYQTVYAYNLPIDKRKIYYGLELERNLLPALQQDPHWVRKWLNPHTIAAARPNPYTRYTLISLVRCLLEFADAEFTRDTGESVAKARTLYMTARDLLALPELDLLMTTDPIRVLLPNPILESLRLHVEIQLLKLHQGRNIAGMKRQIEIPIPSKTITGTPTVGRGGQLVVPGAQPALHPTPYRYSLLMERSKLLVNIAQQIEPAYLSALEKLDVANYDLKHAGFDLDLAEAEKNLQALRVTEAQKGERLATLQQDLAEIQRDTYSEWIDAGFNEFEERMLREYEIIKENKDWIASLDTAATTAQTAMSIGASSPFSALAIAGMTALYAGRLASNIVVNAAEQRLQTASLYASQERRKQDWELQRSLAVKNVEIGAQQILIAQDHTGVVRQEKAISDTKSAQAKAMVDFLANKFTNADLYEWMSGVLAGVYSYFLQQATVTAKLAENQLAFERQQTASFIQSDYWVLPAENGASGTQASTDRRGLTGSARLLQDIYQLDQFAFDSDKRKLNLTQTFSLARLAPFEFQKFRDSGVLPFATPMKLFDQGFPGHYLRLIKRIRTSVVALIPPTQGIRATLTASGISHVINKVEDVFQETMVRRDPEMVALTSPTNASGIFELDTQSEMLLPFESMGVDTTWEFQMPKAANPFDFNTIADVLVTIEYTALNEFYYRKQVIQNLDPKISAERPFSLRHEFADAWYDLHNPDQAAPPAMTVTFETRREDFPPNITDLKIQEILLYFACTNGDAFNEAFKQKVVGLMFTAQGEANAAGGDARPNEGVISTRRGNGEKWVSVKGQSPAGAWRLSLPDMPDIRKLFDNEDIENILLVITYSGRTPEWPI